MAIENNKELTENRKDSRIVATPIFRIKATKHRKIFSCAQPWT